MRLRKGFILACLFVCVAARAAAQDQKIVVAQPLKVCSTTAPLDEAHAGLWIAEATGAPADPAAYYVLHNTLFAPATNQDRMVAAEEQWNVYHAGWINPKGGWLLDSRYKKHFEETRIFGSSNVGLVYRYANVPIFVMPTLQDVIDNYDQAGSLGARLRRAYLATEVKTFGADAQDLRRRLARPDSGVDAADVDARVQNRPNALQTRQEALKAQLSAADEQLITNLSSVRLQSAAADAELARVVWLDVAAYLQAFARGDRRFMDELPLVSAETGQKLVPIGEHLATTNGFRSLATLLYEIDVTKKTAAPVANFKTALAIVAQSGDAKSIDVPMTSATLCAGQRTPVKPLPSDLNVRAINMSDDGKDEVERSKQLFDNEAKSWWDVSFVLPADFRRDLSVDADAGQLAGKSVEKTDLYGAINVGVPRDTKRLQWQFVPNVVYGVSITGKPLHHQFFGFSLGFNYFQLIVGWKLDRTQIVSETSVNGLPVAEETTAPGNKWEHTKWSRPLVGINLPVSSVAKLFKKSDDKDDKK